MIREAAKSSFIVARPLRAVNGVPERSGQRSRVEGAAGSVAQYLSQTMARTVCPRRLDPLYGSNLLYKMDQDLLDLQYNVP